MKFKSKSLISIILSIMMVMSMILVAIPANAAVADSVPVGAGPYYLWYITGTQMPTTTYATLEFDGGTKYSCDFTNNNSNQWYTFLVNKSTSNPKDSSTVWTQQNKPNIVCDETFKNNHFWNIESSDQDGYGIIKLEFKSACTVKLTYNETGKTLTLSEAGSTPTSSTHNVTVGTHENGTVELVSDSPAEVGSTFEFKVKANDNYAIDNVSLSDSTDVTEGNTDGDGYTHYTFTMPDTDVTINATFKSTATPTKNFALIGAYITDKDGNTVGTSGTFASHYTDSNAIKFDDNNQITIKVDDAANARFQIIDNSNNIYKSTASRLQVAIDGTENSAKTSNSSTFAFQTSGAGTYTLTITNYTDGEVKFTASKEVEKYTVTAGTCTGGSVTVGGSTSSVQVASGGIIPVIAEAAENYEFVSWNAVEGVEFENVNSATTNATITGNATITATFRSTSTEPTEMFYLEYWDGSNHQYIPYTSYADGVFTWETNFNFGSFSSDGKFRITNSEDWPGDSNAYKICVPAYKARNNKQVSEYVKISASGVTVNDSLSGYYDIILNGINTSKTYIVTYKIGETNSLDGQITIADKSVTPTLATPKIKGDSSALPGSTITVALDNQKDFGTDEDGNGKYTANDDSLTFTYTVTASDGTTPVVTPTASGKIAKSDGTAINDKISFTASSDNGVTYTITCKVSADDFADVTSSELTVKVGTIPYAQADRIYAYAKTLGADETPCLNAWVASETNTSTKLNTHNDNGKVNPTLGNTSDTDIRIFLPTTASSTKVVLYNSFNSAITVNGTEIPSGGYKEVSYTPNTEYTISNRKKLTIYKSTADGALYVNNTGEFASIDDNGALSMINKLYSDKEEGEIAAGNAGALADANGVKDVAVKKIKGRGNSTWRSANKKSFNVTFDKNIKAFGFEKGKKFSLLANFKDPSLSRNKILYELADLMGVKYSPDAATVDLYMNGLYMGSYLMCQKVEVGSNELVNDLGETLLEDLYKDATGKVPDTAANTIKTDGFSFLIELDSNATTGDFYTTVDDQKITIKEPEYLNDDNSIPNDAVTNAAIKFVEDRYKELNTAMSNTSITLEQLNNFIDVDSLAKYYLVNEIAKNYDIGVSSTYLVYNYTDKKFYISPLWDMDVTTANCKADNENYQSYASNWTDNTNENTGNKFMATVFKNPQVQSAARKLWTNSYYTTLTGYIDTLTTKATNVEGSLNCNYTKWNYPYGFQGEYSDNVLARTSLKKATYNPSDNSYTVDSSETDYATTAVGQTLFVSDWLKSRVAWMSKKYNTYTIAGLTGWSGDKDKAIMTNNGDGTHTYTFTSTAEPTFGIKIYTDNGIENTDISKPENSTHACIWYDPDVQLVVNTSRGTLTKTKGDKNNFGVKVTEASAEAPVYLIYNQKTNTLTLSDTESTSTKPSVTLTGSDVLNENIKDGTAVALTAKITPATSNNAVVTGDYTATLYIGEKKVTAKTVTFTAADDTDTKDVVFDTYLKGTNQTYKVVVTCNDGDKDLTATSNTFTYKQTGVKDQKIYFDPSTYSTNKNVNDTSRPFPWLEAIDKDSTVTVKIKNSNSTQLATFKMYIDSEDVYGLAKGVFRADIDETTLGYLKVPTNTIHFELDGKDGISTDDYNDTIYGSESITSGWIYNYSWQNGQSLWEQYNVDYVEAYPGGCTTYAQFKDYLANQATDDTDHIVYFDNSASKFYNVYLYCWGEATTKTGLTTNAVLMKKLPYADIWYYDFGSNMPTKDFLFKDRSNAGFGNNYQETVDLVGNNNASDHNQCVQDGNDTWIPLNFEGTISTPNPIFITQNFYKVTEKNGGGTLKFRAFNTEWQEFSAVVESEVQTKAVDVYFDLHNKTATDIQLYHLSTSNNYSFATKFTRLTPLPGSTIYHSTIMLPYTDKGIAFKFDRFIVDYSDGSTKTCAMSNNVQPTFTCINTGEVWYEINSNFDSVSNDAETGANLLQANSPLLTATSTDIYLIGGMNNWTESDTNWQLTSTDGNMYTGTFTISGGSSAISFKVFDSSNSGNKYFANGNYQFNSSNTVAEGLNNSDGTADMSIMPIATSGDITLNVKYYREYSRQTRLEITQSVATPVTSDYYVADAKIKVSPFTGTETKLVNNGEGIYSYHYTDIAAGNYAFKITDGTNWNVATRTAYSSSKSSLSSITVDNTSDTKYDKIKVSLSSTTSFTVYYDGTNIYIIEDSSAPTPTISLSAGSTSLILGEDGIASTTLTASVTDAGEATVYYTVEPSTNASVSGNTFTATAAGQYTVTASIIVGSTTYSAPVTITVSEPVTTDYCGVLAYNHSTATFDVTGGGTIGNTDVVLTNGYYTTGTVTTGYTSYDGTTYTVIYALPSTGKTDASTSYSSETSHSDLNYTFDGWTKDGVVKTDNTTLTDSIIGTATVAYVANWSEEVMVTYTFTYKYDMYDTTAGREYDSNRPLKENSDYFVQISLSADADNDEIIAAYLANAPKISSDYFTYTFDGVTVTIVNTDDTHTAEAKANIAGVKKYKVTVDSDSAIIAPKDYFYQNIAELTSEADAGYVTVWKDENNNILYVGNTYKFRVTRNIVLTADSVAPSSINPETYINEPTYEFYTKSDTEYVRFNFRVDNVLSGVTPYEYGTLYFFTDENGVPVDSSISVDDNIDDLKLAAAAMGSASTGIKKYNATGVVNKDHKFIYAPSLKNTVANRDRYLRVYSYFIYKDKDGNDVVVISADSVIASIRNALNQS